jgi:hypothetical protein
MSDFKTTCPRCKAAPEDAMLEVVSGIFRARAMYLQPDGFATMHAKQFDTDEEQVYCHACEQTMSLGECLDDEMNDEPDEQEPKQICPRCQQYLDGTGSCRVCQYPAAAPPGFSVEQWQAVEKLVEKLPDEQEVAGAAERISTAIDHILTDTNTPSRVLAAALRQLAKELGG